MVRPINIVDPPNYNEMVTWAKENCSSLAHYELCDMTDISYHIDCFATFVFDNDTDAVLFALRWGIA